MRSTDENIGTSIHFLPVHRLSAYRDRLAPHQPPLPVTERAGAEVLSLPLSPAHSDDDVRDAVAALRRVHERLSRMKRSLRVAATLLVTALAVAYILSKIDLGKTRAHPRRRRACRGCSLSAVADARHGAADGLALAAAARRARRPRARRLADARLLRLLRRRAGAADVGRRRRVAHLRDVAAASRADHADHRLGAARARARRRGHAAARRASGFLLAIGRYPIGAYLWIEALFVVATIAAGVRLLLAHACAAGSRSLLPLARRLRVETPARAVYDGIHGYRDHPGTLLVVASSRRPRS